MLTNETMGLLGLGILWVNTLLVAAAALARARAIAALRERIGRSDLVRGLFSGEGATLTIEQVGRYGAGSGRTILWHDRSYASRILGGAIDAGGTSVELEATNDAMVWVDESEVAARAACPSSGAFDTAFAAARKARGHARTLEMAIANREVFACRLAGAPGVLAPSGTLLVSTIDPVAWCRKREAVLSLLFVPASLIIAALFSAVALYPPHFGTVSMVGAALSLLFFLLVLPAGTTMRDWARLPHERIVRGRWTDPAEAGAAPAPARI